MTGYKITRQSVNELERQRNDLDRRLNECGVENTELRLAFEETLRDRNRYFYEMNEVRQKFYDMIGERDEYRDRLETTYRAAEATRERLEKELEASMAVVEKVKEWSRVADGLDKNSREKRGPLLVSAIASVLDSLDKWERRNA